MPEYDVTFVRRLELIGRFTINAKDTEVAETKATEFVEACINDSPISWSIDANSAKFKKVEWEYDVDDYDDIEVNEL